MDIVGNTYPNPDAIILSAGLSGSSSTGPSAVSDLTLDVMGRGSVLIRLPRTATDKVFNYQYALDSDSTNWQTIRSVLIL